MRINVLVEVNDAFVDAEGGGIDLTEAGYAILTYQLEPFGVVLEATVVDE
jgi:hypothetical protein